MSNHIKANEYETTRAFTGGILKGLNHTAISNVYTKPGTVVDKPYGNGSPYVITECKLVTK